MSLAVSTALSAMMAAQRTAEVSSHNIANANTPGYSRQTAVLRPALPVRTSAGMMGTGVTIERIMAIRDDFLNLRIGAQKTALGRTEARRKMLAELEAVIMPGPDTGLSRAIDEFFTTVNELSTNPQSAVSRESVRHSAISLSGIFHSTINQLRQIQSDLKNEYDQAVGQINSYFGQIADLNGRVMAVSEGSDTANDLTDRRNLAIENLSRLIPIQVAREKSAANILFEGRLMVGGTDHMTVASDSSGGRLKLCMTETAETCDTAKGMLGGKAELYNDTLPRYIGYIDELARSLVREFNAIHSTGVSLQNGYTALTSAAELADVDLDEIVGDEPLSLQPLAFPPEAGRLYITVTNDATGEMYRAAIDYDPTTDSVIDIADRIAAMPHMNAAVSSGYLTMTAWPGYRFDFSNKLLPDGGSLGASQISVSGAYTGANDRLFTFYPMSSGIIGETEDLTIAVTSNEGSFLGLLNVGSDYTPGTMLSVTDGVKVSFGAGAVQAAQAQSGDQPFAFLDDPADPAYPDTLTVSINGEPVETIQFNVGDFADITQATAEEVAQVINAAAVGVEATIVGDAVLIRPTTTGPDSSIKFGGTAAAALGLSTDTITTDSQTIEALGETDTGNLLTALGINAFFEGSGAGDIGVSAYIQASVANIAAAKSTPPGDNANALRLAQIKQRPVVDQNTQTLNEFFGAVVGNAGLDASYAMSAEETQTKLVASLERQRDSIAGVSLEEEMAALVQNQQAYLAAVKLIRTLDEMLDSLMTL